mmetsp:Transcript_45040/g.74990  ORF Transcript_45040/g.74990 Transcript_45040/m.74990 type:complete len:257 (+) Transcript_45040:131-901(+)
MAPEGLLQKECEIWQKECEICGGIPPNCPGKHVDVDEDEFATCESSEAPESAPTCAKVSQSNLLIPQLLRSAQYLPVPCSPPKSLGPSPKNQPTSPQSERPSAMDEDLSQRTPPKSQPALPPQFSLSAEEPQASLPDQEPQAVPTLLAASGATPKPTSAKVPLFHKAASVLDHAQTKAVAPKRMPLRSAAKLGARAKAKASAAESRPMSAHDCTASRSSSSSSSISITIVPARSSPQNDHACAQTRGHFGHEALKA